MKHLPQALPILINTGALARCKHAPSIGKVFQHFSPGFPVSRVAVFAHLLFLLLISPALAATLFVDVNSTNATTPYTSWTTAATNIQDAVDAAITGDEIVVTNGIYAPVLVSVDKLLSIRSVNGSQLTTIDAHRSGSCAYGAILCGFTLTGGYSDVGGGAVGGELNNCTLTDNWAEYGGGGAYGGTLNNCTLTGNLMIMGFGGSGAAAWDCYLYNCTVTGNRGGPGAYAVDDCRLWNCIVYYNSLNYNPGYSALTSCCTMPGRISSLNDTIITNAPLFVDLGSGNLRLQSNSPCINIGENNYVVGSTDLDGRPRLVGGTVDIGAYEFQPGVSGQFLGWLQRYKLPTSGSADFTDPDGDAMNNWQEWRCATDPTNVHSALRLLPPIATSTNVTVSWQSVSNVNYFLERSVSLATPPAFTLLATNIPGQPATTIYTDTNGIETGPCFYRVGVSQ